MKPPAPSIWGQALDHLAQARKSSWTQGAATGAAWDAVNIGEEALLAAAPSPALVGEKLRYLLAVAQVPEVAALRQREQPWCHRLLRSAIEDVARVGTSLAAAQAEADRLQKGVRRPPRTSPEVVRLREQIGQYQTGLQEAAAERDAALAALARVNHHPTLAATSGGRAPM